MSTLYICRGVPASGKTHFAMEWVAEDPSNRIRINRDDIRFTNFGKYWGVDERLVSIAQDCMMQRFMREGLDIISDSTNLQSRAVKHQMELADKWGYGVEFYDFPISFTEALGRDLKRDKQVGEKVLRSFFNRFIGKDGVSLPNAPAPLKPLHFPLHVHEDGLPSAILVDIDGTLAHHEGVRNPYDTTRYHMDRPDHTIARIVESTDVDAIFIMSGRDAEFRDVLTQWLSDKLSWRVGTAYDAIFMRPNGDRRNDAIVKNELFEENIAGKYNVQFVLDDRNRVVDMWRAKGIKCLQVQDGDF